ncbi:MAG: DedA family protein [Candidatus Aramenus sulfurataquae]|jgi:membrane protein DedA with SNARE-associated domain|uniref:DedA family protein n=3 Tax=Candidatus Aramenus sulfurataquae TaxID=1326980 RepID=W7KVM3_9CREN|nr:MAG: DedA family protein [Candidatus Aramenus sulfurataquae]MCL7343916.1 DedA family protein [Candidatus Aramenus sulfurataquae]
MVYSYALIFGLMVLEGIGFPVPSEVIMPYVGYFSRLGSMDLAGGITVGTLGSLVGSIIDYYVALKLGLPFLKKYGRAIRLNEGKLALLNKWFDRHGAYAVFGFRFVPEIRALISLPAGLARMNLAKFVVFTALGHLIWDTLLATLGYIYYAQVGYLTKLLETYSAYLFVLGVVVVAVLLAYNLLRK